MVYNRILLKLSGEALLGGRSHGIDPKTINKYSEEQHFLDEFYKIGFKNRAHDVLDQKIDKYPKINFEYDDLKNIDLDLLNTNFQTFLNNNDVIQLQEKGIINIKNNKLKINENYFNVHDYIVRKIIDNYLSS